MPTDGSTPTGNTYDKYGSTNPIEQRMMRGFFGALDGFLDGLNPRRVLEIGVGEGIVNSRLTERFPDASVLGLDLPDDGLAADWGERGLSCVFGDATTLPFPDDAFDLVMAIEVFEHLPDPETSLAELARVCSGSLIASVPFEPIWRLGNMARGRYLRDLGNTPGHINHWTNRGFSRLVATRFDVADTANPLPWTMVRADVA
ncbi:MAG: class I SAM-dependent methyltransferase [Ilumatobacteraceae bacterium]